MKRILLLFGSVAIVVLSALIVNFILDWRTTNDDIRIANLDELRTAVVRYKAAHNGNPPPVKEAIACLGVDDETSCWSDVKAVSPPRGDKSLNEAISPYTADKKIPLDPDPNRPIGKSYLYATGTIMNGCSPTAPLVTGQFLLWVPDRFEETRDCLNRGFMSCCGPGGGLCRAPLYCASKID